MKVKQLLTRTAGAFGVTAGLLFVGSPLMAQVKIGDNPNNINPSSILELESATKGLLLPRVPLTSRTSAAPVTNAVAGMHVYNTTENAELQVGEYYYNGTEWEKLVTVIPEDRYIYADGPATGACANGKIWVNVLDGSPTEGKQWICRNGVWDPYSTPSTVPFYQGFGTTDPAGPAKGGTISRLGVIASQRFNGDKSAVIGRSTVAPGGILQLFRSTAIDPAYGAAIDFTTNLNNPYQYRIGIRNDIQNGALVFHQTNPGVSQPQPRMMLTPSGKLGLGTISIDADNLVHFVGTLQGSAAATTPEQLGGTSSTAGYRLFYDGVNNTSQVVINSGSNADTPVTNLSNLKLVKRTGNAGEVYAEFIANSTLVGSISRSNTGVAYNQTSDRRLKENIKSTRYTIDDLMKVGVVDYNYKSDAAKTTVTGFIAQDLFKVFPDAVTKGGDDVKTKPWLVDYSKVTPLLVKAIQDQQKEIAALKAQLSEMNALKAEVASIKAMLDNAAQQKSETTISK